MRIITFSFAILLSLQLLSNKNSSQKGAELCQLIVQEQETDSSTQLPKDDRAAFISECVNLLNDEIHGCNQAQLAHSCEVFSFSSDVKKLPIEQYSIYDQKCSLKSDLLSLVNQKLENNAKGLAPKNDLDRRIQQYKKQEKVLTQQQADLTKKVEAATKKDLELTKKMPASSQECSLKIEALIRVVKKMLIDAGASFQRCRI